MKCLLRGDKQWGRVSSTFRRGRVVATHLLANEGEGSSAQTMRAMSDRDRER